MGIQTRQRGRQPTPSRGDPLVPVDGAVVLPEQPDPLAPGLRQEGVHHGVAELAEQRDLLGRVVAAVALAPRRRRLPGHRQHDPLRHQDVRRGPGARLRHGRLLGRHDVQRARRDVPGADQRRVAILRRRGGLLRQRARRRGSVEQHVQWRTVEGVWGAVEEGRLGHVSRIQRREAQDADLARQRRRHTGAPELPGGDQAVDGRFQRHADAHEHGPELPQARVHDE